MMEEALVGARRVSLTGRAGRTLQASIRRRRSSGGGRGKTRDGDNVTTNRSTISGLESAQKSLFVFELHDTLTVLEGGEADRAHGTEVILDISPVSSMGETVNSESEFRTVRGTSVVMGKNRGNWVRGRMEEELGDFSYLQVL